MDTGECERTCLEYDKEFACLRIYRFQNHLSLDHDVAFYDNSLITNGFDYIYLLIAALAEMEL